MKSKKAALLILFVVSLGWALSDLLEFQNERVPQLESERRGAEGRLAGRQGELRKLQNFARNIQGVKQELREMNLQLDSALESMPRTFNLSELLRKLNLLAQNSGVELYIFKPKASQGENVVPGQFYSALEVEFSLRGSFAQTLIFFDQVSRLKRIVHVQSLKMKRRAADKQNLKSGLVVAETDATIQTFRFRD